MDLFVRLTELGVKTVLWYGFETLGGEKEIKDRLRSQIKNGNLDAKSTNLHWGEIQLEIIREDEIIVNPGILGCGILVVNLSDKSIEEIELLGNDLTFIYKDALILDKYPGGLRYTNVRI